MKEQDTFSPKSFRLYTKHKNSIFSMTEQKMKIDSPIYTEPSIGSLWEG